MSLLIPSPYELFSNRNGLALDSGYIYIGTANLAPQASPITVYWDSALTIPAVQPIRTTVGGFPSQNGTPGKLFASGSYSILIQDKNHALVFSAADPVADMASGILTLLKSVDGSGSGLISEGLQSIEITDLNFDPTVLGLAIRETRAYSTNFGPANQPNNSVVDYFNIFLTKMDATSYILSMDGMDLNTNPTGGHFTRWYTAGAWGAWRWFVDEYDFVVDSNQALDQLIAYTGGLYARVLIKAGTWTATSLSATAGVLWNLDSSGTTYVFGEIGSSIVFSGAFAGTMYGLYRAVIKTDFALERFSGVNVTLTNTTATRTAFGFYNITNLSFCSSSTTGGATGEGTGFSSCSHLLNCIGLGLNSNSTARGFSFCTYLSNCIGTGNGSGSQLGTGFSSCNNLSNCTGTGTGGFSNPGTGFGSCTDLSNCIGTGNGGATAVGRGFLSCTNLSNCTGTGNGGATSGDGLGFSGCTQVIGCRGVGLAAGAGNGYGFFGSQSLQQNRALSASKTATYNTSFADVATNATAATAAGGYNIA